MTILQVYKLSSDLSGGVQYPPICNLPRLGNKPQELARIKADLN